MFNKFKKMASILALVTVGFSGNSGAMNNRNFDENYYIREIRDLETQNQRQLLSLQSEREINANQREIIKRKDFELRLVERPEIEKVKAIEELIKNKAELQKIIEEYRIKMDFVEKPELEKLRILRELKFETEQKDEKILQDEEFIQELEMQIDQRFVESQEKDEIIAQKDEQLAQRDQENLELKEQHEDDKEQIKQLKNMIKMLQQK